MWVRQGQTRYGGKRQCAGQRPVGRRRRKIFHSQRGELRQAYEGREDQLGELGLVLNAATLRNTRYTEAAVARLRSQENVDDTNAAGCHRWLTPTSTLSGQVMDLLSSWASRSRVTHPVLPAGR
jgi:hypothetical protein